MHTNKFSTSSQTNNPYPHKPWIFYLSQFTFLHPKNRYLPKSHKAKWVYPIFPSSPTPKHSPSILYPPTQPRTCPPCPHRNLPVRPISPALSRSPGHNRHVSLRDPISISFIGHPSFSSWTTGVADRNRIERDSAARGGCGRHIVRLSPYIYSPFSTCTRGRRTTAMCAAVITFCVCCFCVVVDFVVTDGVWFCVTLVLVDLWMYRSNIFYLAGRCWSGSCERLGFEWVFASDGFLDGGVTNF